MSTTRRPVPRRQMAYGPRFVVTFDEDKRTAPRSVDAANIKKIDKILGLVEQMLERELAQQPRAKSLMEELEELAAMYERDARQQGINPFPEAPSRDYDARNPHKSREKRSEWWDESSVTVPARRMSDSARRPMTICEQCEAAYAARNPHKRKEMR